MNWPKPWSLSEAEFAIFDVFKPFALIFGRGRNVAPGLEKRGVLNCLPWAQLQPVIPALVWLRASRHVTLPNMEGLAFRLYRPGGIPMLERLLLPEKQGVWFRLSASRLFPVSHGHQFI